jgi:hypothetical protein
LNPYYLGLKIFEDIERRWDQPSSEDKSRFGYKDCKGKEKMFEVREFDSDTSFIHSYLTKELVEDLDLYVFEKKGAEWKITEKAWESVRDQLVYSRVNGGFPYLYVEDGNYLDNGELYLKHAYEVIELDLKYIERTLPYVYQLWNKSVHLQTMIEDKAVLFSYDGEEGAKAVFVIMLQVCLITYSGESIPLKNKLKSILDFRVSPLKPNIPRFRIYRTYTAILVSALEQVRAFADDDSSYYQLQLDLD